jgi:hypothetical protein
MQPNNPLSTVWSPGALLRSGEKTLIQTFQIPGNDLPCCFHYCTDHRKTAMSPPLKQLNLFIVQFLHWILMLDRPK